MLNYRLNQWLWCSYKGIHITINNHICTKNNINNQSKQRPTPPNNPIFKTILLNIYRILNSAFIMNVSVEPSFRKKNLINWHWKVFPLSSSFQFPYSFQPDHFDQLKMSQLSLNVNHRPLHNHHKTSIKHTPHTDGMAQCTAYGHGQDV